MSISEIEGVAKAVADFVNALKLLDYDEISRVFFQDGRSYTVSKDEIIFVERDHWREMRENRLKEGKSPESQTSYYEIKSVNVVDPMASVVVQIGFNDDPVDFLDMYLLLREGDQWRIVGKIGKALPKKEVD